MEITEDTKEEPTIENPRAVLEALERAKNDAKKYREERDSLQARVTDLENGKDDSAWKSRAIKAEARLALGAQGIKNPDRILKLLDLDSVDVDDEGNISNLDEKISSVKADWPELFDVKRSVGGRGDIFKDTPANHDKSVNELQADILLGK